MSNFDPPPHHLPPSGGSSAKPSPAYFLETRAVQAAEQQAEAFTSIARALTSIADMLGKLIEQAERERGNG